MWAYSKARLIVHGPLLMLKISKSDYTNRFRQITVKTMYRLNRAQLTTYSYSGNSPNHMKIYAFPHNSDQQSGVLG
jgi:hypothetical protein